MTENQFAHGIDGTQCMHVFDHTELETYLAAHIEGFGRLDQIEKFSDGQSKPTYKLTSGATQFVLRAKPIGKLMKSAHQVDREFRVMRALAGTDVPVPKMLHLSGEDTPMGTMFFVMEMVNGRIFWDPALPELAKYERAAIYDQMNAVLAALHLVDPAVVGLGDFGKPGNYFERQLARWSAQYKASETEDLADADWLIGWLNDHLVADDGASSIVHGDYRIDNMIFAMHSTNVVALLDWELSTLGHPLADLAYQCMHWRLPHVGHFRGLGGVDQESNGLPSEQGYVDLYCERRGISRPDNWQFYVVFAYFRLLAILQGVLRRALDGNASNPKNTTQTRHVIEVLAKDARALAGA